MRKNKDKAWAEFDINPSGINFSYASSKQQTYEVAEVKAKVKGAGGGLFEISLEIDFMSVSNRGE